MQNENNEKPLNPKGQQEEALQKLLAIKAAQDAFDHRMKMLLNEAVVQPPEGLFDQIEKQLHPPTSTGSRLRRPRKILYSYYAAAVLTLAIMAGILWQYSGRPVALKQSIADTNLAKNEQAGLSNATQSENPPDTGLSGKRLDGKALAKATGNMESKIPVTHSNHKENGEDRIAVSRKQTPSFAVDRQPDKLASAQIAMTESHNASPDRIKLRPSAVQEQSQPADNSQTTLNEQSYTTVVVKKATIERNNKAIAAQDVASSGNPVELQASDYPDKAVMENAIKGAEQELVKTEEKAVAIQTSVPRSRKKKGLLKGLFTHIKNRVNEISENVVDEESDKTTYNLGFVAVTAYK